MNAKPKSKPSFAQLTAPLLVSLVLILLSLSGYLSEYKRTDDNVFLVISVVQIVIFAFPCIIYYFIKGRKLSTPMFMSPVKPNQILFILFSFMVLVTGTTLIRFFYYAKNGSAPIDVNFFKLADTSSASTPEIVIAFVLVPAICEELFFRGIVLSEYRSLGTFTAVAMSAVCFSLAHFSFEALPIYIFGGIVLGVCAVCCRSVFAPMIIHIGNNLLSIYTSDRFLRITIQKCGVYFVFFVLTVAFLISLLLMLSRAESIMKIRSENPPADAPVSTPILSGLKKAFVSPAFFVLLFVFVLITILLG